MAEPFDFYTEIASVSVTPTGWTLSLLRTIPIPVQRSEGVVNEEAAIQAEIVARVRFTEAFAVELRDLLSRVLDQPAPKQAKSHGDSTSSLAVSDAPNPGG